MIQSIDSHLEKSNPLKFSALVDEHLQLFFNKALNQDPDERFRNTMDIISF